VFAAMSLGHGHCQESGRVPAFEVASITPSKPGAPAVAKEHARMARFTAPGGRFSATATTLTTLFEWAWSIQPAEHSGGPAWMDTDRYDIAAKAEGNPSDDEMKRMVQTLLAERFQLKFHREKKNMGVLAMSTGKAAPKLAPPAEGETQAIRVIPQTGPDQKIASYRVVATRFPLSQLTAMLAQQLDRVVVNETGLDGDFDFTVDLTPDESLPNPLDPTLLMTAMREQLGLIFKSENAPVDIFVIDGAQKVAAGN